MSENFQINMDAVTDEEIKAMSLLDSQLWFVRADEITTGPYLESVLAEYIQKNAAFMQNYEACNAEEKTWKNIFEQSRLQRRLQPTRHTKKSGIFLLINGQEAGPYENEEVALLLKKNELKFTDFISIDGGINWTRVYDNHDFNRRKTKDDLPFMPDAMVFQNSDAESVDFLNSQKHQLEIEKEDALVALAYKGADGSLHNGIPPVLEATATHPGLPPNLPPVSPELVGEKVGEGPKFSADEIDNEEHILDGPPPIPVEKPEDAMTRKKKLVWGTTIGIMCIMILLSGGEFRFFKSEKTADVLKSNRKKTIKTVIKRPQMRQNIQNTKRTIPRRVPATHAPKAAIAPSAQDQKKLRESFKNAKTIQKTHSSYNTREPSNEEVNGNDYPFEERIEDAKLEQEALGDTRKEERKELSDEEYEDGRQLVDEIRREQKELDGDSTETFEEVSDF